MRDKFMRFFTNIAASKNRPETEKTLLNKIGDASSKLFKACMYYITIAMLLIDPVYLSVLCGFFGGGDMNGISLLFPEIAVRIVYGIILAINIAVFMKIVLPKYQLAFSE